MILLHTATLAPHKSQISQSFFFAAAFFAEPFFLPAGLLAGPARVRDLFVEGRPVVRGGDLVSFDLAAALRRQNDLARRLMA